MVLVFGVLVISVAVVVKVLVLVVLLLCSVVGVSADIGGVGDGADAGVDAGLKGVNADAARYAMHVMRAVRCYIYHFLYLLVSLFCAMDKCTFLFSA